MLETPPDIIMETLYQSLAFFYVNPILNAFGLSFIPDVPVRPVVACLPAQPCGLSHGGAR